MVFKLLDREYDRLEKIRLDNAELERAAGFERRNRELEQKHKDSKYYVPRATPLFLMSLFPRSKDYDFLV